MSASDENREVYRKTINCFLGWSRRNVYPPHPNIHTDHNFAQERGFDSAIMSASQVVPHLHEALIEILGEQTFFNRTDIRYKMVNPVGAEGAITITITRQSPTKLALKVDNELDKPAIIGEATVIRQYSNF